MVFTILHCLYFSFKVQSRQDSLNFCKKVCNKEEPLCSMLITKGMVPVSLNYMQWSTAGNTASQVRSIVPFAHSKHPDQAYLGMNTGRKKLTHPLWRLTRSRKCLTLLFPLLV